MISLETLIELSKREAFAHNYVGFLVVEEKDGTYSRVFLQSKDELEPAKTSMRVHGIKVIEEVFI